MSDSMPLVKNDLRKECKRIRNDLGEDKRNSLSQMICSIIEKWQIFQESQCILTYAPIKGEVNLLPLVERWHGKTWALPRIIPGVEGGMDFHLYDPAQLVLHPYGMAEPTISQPVILPKDIRLAFVPGLAYTREGWRLGYGGGYFDRFLCGFSGISVGITYADLILKELSRDSFDVPVQWIVTEDGILSSSRGYNQNTYVQNGIS
jgi:5-formyltetrahydrofolate cyclo-ligase